MKDDKIEIKNEFIIVSNNLHKAIKNITQTHILSNLINKYNAFSDGTILTKNNKEYHFYFYKKVIYQDELYIDKNTYNAALKSLEEKGFIKTFTERAENNKLKNVTYFWLNIKLINSILDNKDVQEEKPKAEKKETLKQPENKPKQIEIKKQTLSPIVAQKLADLETKFKCRFIDEEQYAFQKLIIMKSAI